MAPPRSRILFSNFASSVLSADIEENDTNIPLRPGDGVRFPQPEVGFSWFAISLESSDGNNEICRCTNRTGDVLVVERAAEGTTTVSFSAGSRVECRVTAGVLSAFMQQEDPSTDQTLYADVVASKFYRSIWNEEATQIAFGSETHGVYPYIGTDPNEGILSNSDLPVGVILMWSGAINAIPALWKLCDGTNGTPDLRDKFVRGAGGEFFPPGTAKADWGTRTEPVPVHNHSGVTFNTTLELRHLPKFRPTFTGHTPGDHTGGSHIETSPDTGRVDGSSTDFDEIGGDVGHHHGLAFDGGYPTGIRVPDVSPAYYALAFIMKVA